MDKPYILIYSPNMLSGSGHYCIERFECALDMDEFVNTELAQVSFLSIIFSGKVEQEIKYGKKYMREIMKEKEEVTFPREWFIKCCVAENI